MQSDRLKRIKSEIQEKAKKISRKLSQILINICSATNAQCKIKSINECEGTDEYQCIRQYPKNEMCVGKGLELPKSSGVRFPNHIDIQQLSNQNRLLVCATAAIDEVLKEIKNNHTNQIERSYLGFRNGFFRGFPGFQQQNSNGKCHQTYIPSERIWNLLATTGSKNIVIAIDISQNMNQNYFQQIKQAAIKLINKLSFNDFVSVVFFGENAQILDQLSLRRATQTLKSSLQYGIKAKDIKFYSDTHSNYEKAFQLINKLFSSQISNKNEKKCQFSTDIALFFTASLPSSGLQQDQQLIAKIDQLDGLKNMKLFTYGLGQKFQVENKTVLNALSCKFQGAHFNLQAKDLQNNKIMQYVKHFELVLSKGVNIGTPTWTEPYNDAWTGSRMVTVSYPIYRFTTNGKFIVGAVGIDVLMQVLRQETMTEQDAVNKLIVCSPSSEINLDKKFIQWLRPAYSKCFPETLPSSQLDHLFKAPQCNILVNTSVFTPAVVKRANNQVNCCGLKTFELNMLIGFLSFAMLIAILILIFCIYRKKCVKYNRIAEQKNEVTSQNMIQNINNKKTGSEQPQREDNIFNLTQSNL